MSTSLPHADANVRTYRAAWLFPVDQPPLRDGVLVVQEQRIVEVRRYRSDEPVIDLGDVALLPALVNAHTHLEFSELTAPLGQANAAFADWIPQVVAYRRERATNNVDWRTAAIHRGRQLSAECGVGWLGDIVTAPVPAEAYGTSFAGGIFLELLGLADERQEPLWSLAQTHVSSETGAKHEKLRGLSPHAPYTVQPQLLKRVCERSSQQPFPVAMHLAETMEELELLATGTGRLAECLGQLGAHPQGYVPVGVRPQFYLEILASAARALVVHGNYLSAEEWQFLAEHRSQMSVVYCPRTHAYFGHARYPLPEMLAADVQVALGTDSLASNPDLSLWREVCLVRRDYPQLAPATLLQLATLHGAQALGMGRVAGSLTPGKFARVAQLPLDAVVAENPYELLFETTAEPRLWLPHFNQA